MTNCESVDSVNEGESVIPHDIVDSEVLTTSRVSGSRQGERRCENGLLD